MDQTTIPKTINWLKTTRITRWVLLVAWTLILGASLAWNVHTHYSTIEDQARIIARTAFEKDVLYRSWNSDKGGVYVYITPDSQPNPYLKDLPDRDLTTTTGSQLTMINPAYMTRQVFDLQKKNMGVIGHITSLKPIRPANAADEWETMALTAFDAGEKEISGITRIEEQSYLRLMKPLTVEEKCLKCHASQGYTVGQIRGGISETVPLAPLATAGHTAFQSLIYGHIGIWLIGILGILWSSQIVGRSLIRQTEAEQNLLDMATHDKLTGLFNRAYFHETLQQLDDLKTLPISIIMADIDLLKQTNDTLGHDAGDELIRRTSSVFSECFRANDTVARIGGDEFVVLIPNANEDIARVILNRLRTMLANHNDFYEGSPLEISFGIATSRPGELIADVQKRADENMYEEKQRRKAERAQKK
jgi:diguanylate cyclase (GGDEF)-like protein